MSTLKLIPILLLLAASGYASPIPDDPSEGEAEERVEEFKVYVGVGGVTCPL